MQQGVHCTLIMRQSRLFTRARREVPKDEVSKNAQLLIRAGFIHKEFAGVYSYLPLGLRVLQRIATIIREEMESIEGVELLMPALHPLELYETTGRAGIDVLFHTELVSSGKLVLGQSHEEVIVPLAKEYISSYRDLPRAIYQIQTKFRNEKRAKSGVMRGREFLMKDLYSFHADEADFETYYERTTEAYKRVFARAGIGPQTFVTYASGGTFSKFSHEFQTLTEAGEDTIYVCEKCHVAINSEIKEDQPSCPSCGTSIHDLSEHTAIEVGNIFPLKTRFSDAFGLTYKAMDGTEKSVVMGCYGIGLGRLMGTVVELRAQEHSLVWPRELSPFAVHILALGDSEEVRRAAFNLYELCSKHGIETLYDDRDMRAGEKLAESDLIGIPLRIVIGERSLASGAYELVDRERGETTHVAQTELLTVLTTHLSRTPALGL